MIYQNPMAKYGCPETDGLDKDALFRRDTAGGVLAIERGGHKRPLSELTPDRVDFIAGFWRVQGDFPHKIQTVRDQDFVVGHQIDRHEQNMFEYYSADLVAYNCYGPYLVGQPTVVSCFSRGVEKLWAYGPSVEHARAFLAIALFDRNRDLILRAEQGKRAHPGR